MLGWVERGQLAEESFVERGVRQVEGLLGWGEAAGRGGIGGEWWKTS